MVLLMDLCARRIDFEIVSPRVSMSFLLWGTLFWRGNVLKWEDSVSSSNVWYRMMLSGLHSVVVMGFDPHVGSGLLGIPRRDTVRSL